MLWPCLTVPVQEAVTAKMELALLCLKTLRQLLIYGTQVSRSCLSRKVCGKDRKRQMGKAKKQRATDRWSEKSDLRKQQE